MSNPSAIRIYVLPVTPTEEWTDEQSPSTVSASYLSRLVSAVVADPDFAECVRSLVEGYTVKTIVKGFQNRLDRSDPFDPIYLVDLVPDKISVKDARSLAASAKKVKDLSYGVDLFDDDEE